MSYPPDRCWFKYLNPGHRCINNPKRGIPYDFTDRWRWMDEKNDGVTKSDCVDGGGKKKLENECQGLRVETKWGQDPSTLTPRLFGVIFFSVILLILFFVIFLLLRLLKGSSSN